MQSHWLPWVLSGRILNRSHAKRILTVSALSKCSVSSPFKNLPFIIFLGCVKDRHFLRKSENFFANSGNLISFYVRNTSVHYKLYIKDSNCRGMVLFWWDLAAFFFLVGVGYCFTQATWYFYRVNGVCLCYVTKLTSSLKRTFSLELKCIKQSEY